MDYYEEFTSNFDNSNRCLLLCHYQTIHIKKTIQLLFMNLQKNIESCCTFQRYQSISKSRKRRTTTDKKFVYCH